MVFFKTDNINDIQNSDNFIAIFLKDPRKALAAIELFLNKKVAVIPLDPLLPGKKISQCLSTINCKNLIADSSLPPDFDYECRIYDARKVSRVKKPEILSGNLKKIFLNSSPELNRITNILFTSGSTGDSKPVLHTLGNHYYSALGSAYNIKFEKEDKWLVVLPFHHISGFSIIFRTALAGGRIVVKEFDEDISEALKKEKPTHISLVPHQLQNLLNNAKNIDILKKLKTVLLGGARVPAVLAEQSYKYGLNLFVSYGSSEMSSQITCTKNKAILKHLKTSGTLLDFRQIKITKENNILVKGETLFAGYLAKNDNSDL